jgi:predicted enzyme related to lactoylglutathione lyase
VPTRLVELAVDAVDPARLARFWAVALGWQVLVEEPDQAVIWVVLADPEGSEFCVLSPR